jgi:hypothetical protein
MIQIIKDNKDDCDKVVTELQAYTKNHKKDFEDLAEAGKKMEDGMTEEQLKTYNEKMMEKMEPLLKDSLALMMEVGQRCPEKAAQIGESMRAIK